MDILVIVGGVQPPGRVVAKARHVLAVEGHDVSGEVIADIRGRLPRSVSVFGDPGAARTVALSLHQAGLPVELLVDEVIDGPNNGDGVPTRSIVDRGPQMQVANNMSELMGNTPLIRLDRVGRDLECTLLAKLEFMNPGGSVKDRPALFMIEAAEREGLLQPGGTIVEPTSGNTGVGLAIVAAQRKYRCIFTVPDKVAKEKVALLRAYGAEVIVCPTAVDPEHPDSYYSVADRLTREIPGAFRPNQYANPNNPLSHEMTTGPEIWEQTAGRITHFVAGAGTGGTLSGISRALKQRNKDIKIVAADPEGSVYSGGSGRPYLVEGIGEDFWPSTYDPAAVDRVVMVADSDSFATARRVTREEGILVGGSAGTAVWAALEIGKELGPDDVVVVLIPDSGRGYLSKLYDDSWMADHGFLRAAGPTVADLLSTKTGDIPALVHSHPNETVREAIAILQEFGVSQMPVVKAEPPLQAAEVVGCVTEVGLMEAVFKDQDVLDKPVGDVMAPQLPVVGSGEALDHAFSMLEDAPAVMVLDRGHPVGIVTRADLLDFLSKNTNGVGR